MSELDDKPFKHNMRTRCPKGQINGRLAVRWTDPGVWSAQALRVRTLFLPAMGSYRGMPHEQVDYPPLLDAIWTPGAAWPGMLFWGLWEEGSVGADCNLQSSRASCFSSICDLRAILHLSIL